MTDVRTKFPRFLKETEKFPLPGACATAPLRYGTAGFRTRAEDLDTCLYRMGMLAVLRSRCTTRIIGVMITASHNLAQDNGVKLIEPNGEMFKWETYAEELANATNEELPDRIDEIVKKEKIDHERSGNVFIARDTRESSEHLAEIVREGALLLGGNVLDFALLTTPQLHHLVRMWNNETYNRGDWASEAGYYNMLIDGYRQILSMKEKEDAAPPAPSSSSPPPAPASSSNAPSSSSPSRSPLLIDASHGVGALQIRKLFTELNSSNPSFFPFEIRNDIVDNNDKYLNYQCGADFVQKAMRPPVSFTDASHDQGSACVSLDGDADRIIYHYYDAQLKWHVLDGDKMAALFATFLFDQLTVLEKGNEISFGVIQTAYANGAASLYLKTLGFPVLLAKTGVKYCHEKTKEFDISVYFEANGHGTIVFQDKVYEKLQSMESKLTDTKKKNAIQTLLAVYQVMNQAVGDAFSNLLLTEAILHVKGWTITQWDQMYADLPSRQTKIYIQKKDMIQCNEEETQILEPKEIQDAIQQLVTEVEKGRAFVRPSGTENAVRIYAEASTQDKCDELAKKIAKYIHANYEGVGEVPETFVA